MIYVLCEDPALKCDILSSCKWFCMNAYHVPWLLGLITEQKPAIDFQAEIGIIPIWASSKKVKFAFRRTDCQKTFENAWRQDFNAVWREWTLKERAVTKRSNIASKYSHNHTRLLRFLVQYCNPKCSQGRNITLSSYPTVLSWISRGVSFPSTQVASKSHHLLMTVNTFLVNAMSASAQATLYPCKARDCLSCYSCPLELSTGQFREPEVLFQETCTYKDLKLSQKSQGDMNYHITNAASAV